MEEFAEKVHTTIWYIPLFGTRSMWYTTLFRFRKVGTNNNYLRVRSLEEGLLGLFMSSSQQQIVGALRPTQSAHRRTTLLDGLWHFITDPDDGRRDSCRAGLPIEERVPIAVPASWNEQMPELDHFLGPAFYERDVYPPLGLEPEHTACILRFGSVNYKAEVFINGHLAGRHEGGHLPFEVDATPYLHDGKVPSKLVVRVDGRLERSHVPPGGGWGAMAPGCFPSSSFDFYPFCGIQRSVQMCTRPAKGLTGFSMSVSLLGPRGVTADAATTAFVVRVSPDSPAKFVTACLALLDDPTEYSCQAPVGSDSLARLEIEVPNPRLWGPGTPHLYRLRIHASVTPHAMPMDTYEQSVGLRTVQVVSDGLLVNGARIEMRGFGRHEDFPLIGRGDCGAVLVRDHACLRWVGANSYRTAHYPYSEVDLELADEHGILVVSESPCVGLSYTDAPPTIVARQTQALGAMRELLERDCNRACVVAWSVCNEPGELRTMTENSLL